MLLLLFDPDTDNSFDVATSASISRFIGSIFVHPHFNPRRLNTYFESVSVRNIVMLLRLYGPNFFNRLLVVLILLRPSRSIIAGCDPLTTLLMMMLLTVLQYASICHHHIVTDTGTGTGTGTDTDTDTSMYIRSCSCLSDTGISINMF